MGVVRAYTYFHCVVHLGGHEFAGCHDDIFALLAGKVTVDISGIFEQVHGVSLKKLHVLQRLLKLLSFLDDLNINILHNNGVLVITLH